MKPISLNKGTVVLLLSVTVGLSRHGLASPAPAAKDEHSSDRLETQRRNKTVVVRFNTEVIGRGDEAVFWALMDPAFVNRSAPPGASAGPQSMLDTFNKVLRPAFPDLRVTIHDQIAEGDKVTTRKTIEGTHLGPLMDIAPTGRHVTINIIDIVRLRAGRYVEHWGINNFAEVAASLRRK